MPEGREEVRRGHSRSQGGDPQRIPEEDLDDVLAIAQRLQHAAEGAKPTVSSGDVEQIASELAIDPVHVEQAVAELRTQRERHARAEAGRLARRKKLGQTALAALAALVLLGAVLGGVGAIGVQAAERRAAAARTALEVVLDRQLALLPQLVAIGGGQAGSLSGFEGRLRAAREVAAKLAVSREFGAAMAARIGQLPPAQDPSVAQQRLSLQYEVVGSQNRIATEQRRYAEALDAWRGAAGTFTGRVAVGLGWASRPSE